MKNIFKTGLIAIVAMLLAFGCSDDDTTSGSTFFVSISGSSSASGLPGETVTIELTLEASQRIGSLTADGTAVTVNAGELEEVVTYDYTVPATAGVSDAFTVTFVLTDADGNTDSFEVTVTASVNGTSFTEVGIIDLGPGEGAAEISAFSASEELLFVVNNDDIAGNNRIDVIDISDPSAPEIIQVLDLDAFGAAANSVAVGGTQLAVAVENANKQNNGTLLIYDITDLDNAPDQVTVGALPDMVTFSPDGTYIVVANEGEPNDDYTVDPDGTISVINSTTLAVSTATFTAFNSQEATLESSGYRVFGPGADLAADTEPEYVTISADSETAYVSLQENNGIAVVDLATATVTDIYPLGFKDYTAAGNEIDPTDEDDAYVPVTGLTTPLFGVYQPDAIASFVVGGTEYIISANEGDSREYEGTPGFVGEDRVADLTLDPTVFTDNTFQDDDNFGRLKVMLDLGDTGSDGDYDALYSYGARSFSIWSTAGALVYDSGNDLDERANDAGIYADGRSDDKSVEPEGVVVGQIGGSTLAFIGLERVDAVAVYDVSSPSAPVFLSIIEVGDAPEGLVFVPAADSPSGSPLLIVSSEDDGTVRVYQAF